METDATILSHVLHLRRRPPPAQPPSAPSSPVTAAESQPKTTSIPPVLESPPLFLRSCIPGGEEEGLLSPHNNGAQNIALLGDEARKVVKT
uniref:Uncharacterized protein n=1 Tax=Oryza barthii TaxID=65489 RepID=A0A0D3H4H8_9ORYZ